MDNLEEIAQIVKHVTEADAAYYSSTESEAASKLTDEQYDVLKERLRELDPGNPLLNTVGHSPSSSLWPKRKHTIPMGSLTKVKGSGAIKEWFSKISAEVRASVGNSKAESP